MVSVKILRVDRRLGGPTNSAWNQVSMGSSSGYETWRLTVHWCRILICKEANVTLAIVVVVLHFRGTEVCCHAAMRPVDACDREDKGVPREQAPSPGPRL